MEKTNRRMRIALNNIAYTIETVQRLDQIETICTAFTFESYLPNAIPLSNNQIQLAAQFRTVMCWCIGHRPRCVSIFFFFYFFSLAVIFVTCCRVHYAWLWCMRSVVVRLQTCHFIYVCIFNDPIYSLVVKNTPNICVRNRNEEYVKL